MARAIFEGDELAFAEAVSSLAFGNPFLPERIDLERRALGDAFVAGAEVWSVEWERLGDNPNVAAIQRRADTLVEVARERLAAGGRASKRDLAAYEGLALYVLYYRYEEPFYHEILDTSRRPLGQPGRIGFYRRFQDHVASHLGLHASLRGEINDPARLFALFFQTRRAFHHTFRQIYGGSMAMARMRAAVWQSIFTHDPRRYRRALVDRMHEIPTLITGPSGTGKDLVAAAIGCSAFIAFDPDSERFSSDFREIHLALNLSALSPTLIESELFGHRKGSFTGALHDRVGFLEDKGPSHSVFLDEIGDLDPGIQVKLLRVLQTREFRRIGDARTRHFGGKIIAATNRDLAEALRSGRLRDDLYYRLCADLIETPTLAEQLSDAPEELHNLVVLLARRLVNPEDADAVAHEVEQWILNELGEDYPWPGNVRELEQCVRNVMVRGTYRPIRKPDEDRDTKQQLAHDFMSGTLSADQILNRYCTVVYARTGAYQAAARCLQLDRRTVKSRVDAELLEALKSR